MDRNILRKKIIKQRSTISANELHRHAGSITGIIQSAGWYRRAKCVHCFFGVAGKGEIPTGKILEHILASGKILVMPRVTGSDGEMEHIRVHDLSSLTEGAWGIPEPPHGDPVGVDNIDLVFVPGLAADRKGNRIGYGKGYYDRFLSSAPTATKVMILPDIFILDQIPVKNHDVPVDMLVTEKGEVDCH